VAGQAVGPGLFDREHEFTIEPIVDRKSRFVQQETIRGLLVLFFGRGFDKTLTGLRQMNEALKSRAERYEHR
jgi:hypothetical protein